MATDVLGDLDPFATGVVGAGAAWALQWWLRRGQRADNEAAAAGGVGRRSFFFPGRLLVGRFFKGLRCWMGTLSGQH